MAHQNDLGHLKLTNFNSLLQTGVSGPDSSVGTATGYGVEVQGSNPGGGEIFRTCPDRPWG